MLYGDTWYSDENGEQRTRFVLADGEEVVVQNTWPGPVSLVTATRPLSPGECTEAVSASLEPTRGVTDSRPDHYAEWRWPG